MDAEVRAVYAERDAVYETVREFFRYKYGDHRPELWENAAVGKEKALARMLPEHPYQQGLIRARATETNDAE